MTRVKKIGVLSAAKLGAAFYALIGLLVGLLYLPFSVLIAGSMEGSTDVAPFFLFSGIGSIIVQPILFGLLGFITVAISALIFNLVAKITGGLEVGLEEVGGGE